MNVSVASPPAIAAARALVDAPLRAAVDRLDERMRLIASYQMGWVEADGTPRPAGGGKAVRPTLAVLGARAAGAAPLVGVPGAVAVELVHNFSLLHDDVMDRDVERRHRPTGWAVYGDGQAILAGNAMLIAAIEAVQESGPHATAAVSTLLAATQRLITGQAEDLAYEKRTDLTVDDVLHMEAGKTAALLACSASIGAVLAGGSRETVDALAEFGEQLGMAFQLVDDVLGIEGDPAVTGKSSSSDIRAGKRSAPVVAALAGGSAASAELEALLAGGPPDAEADVDRAAALLRESGGLDWAETEAQARLERALAALDRGALEPAARAELEQVARFVVGRDH
ncbi:polyprenyl synthetase family protein [Jatrophihabitans sp. YIM 134969]